MTPKTKAKELFKKYSKGKDEHGWALCDFDSCSKKCALITVDYLMKESETMTSLDYWFNVKIEIEKL
jgi:hypothetical protein